MDDIMKQLNSLEDLRNEMDKLNKLADKFSDMDDMRNQLSQLQVFTASFY